MCEKCQKLKIQGIEFELTPPLTRYGTACKGCPGVPVDHHHHRLKYVMWRPAPGVKMGREEKAEFLKWKELKAKGLLE